MSMDVLENVQRFFDAHAERFDNLYAEGRSGLIDAAFRKRKLRRRFNITLEMLGDIKDATILDVGCGSGVYSIQLAKRGASVTGIDFSPKMIALAQAKSAAEKCHVDFRIDDFLGRRFNQCFDYLLFMGVFDYLGKEQAQQFVQKAARLATRKIVASFPKRWTVESVVRSIWLGRQGCPVHFYTRREIRQTALTSGLQCRFHGCGAIWIAELLKAGASDGVGKRAVS